MSQAFPSPRRTLSAVSGDRGGGGGRSDGWPDVTRAPGISDRVSTGPEAPPGPDPGLGRLNTQDHHGRLRNHTAAPPAGEARRS